MLSVDRLTCPLESKAGDNQDIVFPVYSPLCSAGKAWTQTSYLTVIPPRRCDIVALVNPSCYGLLSSRKVPSCFSSHINWIGSLDYIVIKGKIQTTCSRSAFKTLLQCRCIASSYSTLRREPVWVKVICSIFTKNRECYNCSKDSIQWPISSLSAKNCRRKTYKHTTWAPQ
jgi:hypothetical protein